MNRSRKSKKYHKRRGSHSKGNRKKRLSNEMRFIVDTFLGIFLFLTILRYFPASFFIQLEWFNGNQLFRLGLTLIGIVLFLFDFSRKRSLAANLAAVGIIILIIEGFVYIPLKAKTADVPDARTLRVLTMNCEQQEMDGLLEYLDKQKVELACLQEVHVYRQKDFIANAAEYGYHGHYQHLRRDAGMGILILSTNPFTHIDSISTESAGLNWRTFPKVETTIDSRPIEVIGIQLESVDRKRDLAGIVQSQRFRTSQAKLLSEEVKDHDGYFLVLGDYNSTPTDRSIRPLRRHLKDSWIKGGGGLGATWSSSRALFRIDQILYRDFEKAANTRIDPLLGSDHMAYQVDLFW
ncbi:endonuclease/exonuclease/phosphatase family protein [bacterium]|nr:endonuclease/exonuclease/phosphatase family protein [bacterium]